jgi:hypothetical protein
MIRMQAQVTKPKDVVADTVDAGVPTLMMRTCTKCLHLPVCGIYRAIAPLMESWSEGKEPPFDPVNLAAICTEFSDVTNL